MMRGQLYEQDKNIYEAQQAYRNGVCFNSLLSKQKKYIDPDLFHHFTVLRKAVMKAFKMPT